MVIASSGRLVAVATIILSGLAPAPAASAALGPEWPETGDAGSLPGSHQTPTGSGALRKIHGQLQGPGFTGAGDFQDMFLIYIEDPGVFSASTNPLLGGASVFDTQLWLFGLDGLGVVANDDDGAGSMFSGLRSVATDATGSMVTEGLYYLAISGAGSSPISAGGAPIFDFLDPLEISGPDGAGGSLPISGWDADGAFGTYTIALEGVRFATVPAPGAALLLLMGAMGRRGRRARRGAALR